MPETRLDPVDVVVVGSGLGASAFVRHLVDAAPGLRIVVLERGGWVDRSTLPALKADFQRDVLGAYATSPNVRLAAGGRAPSADYAIDDSGSDFKPLMWSGVGGSTINWAAHFPRFHPSDFRTRTLDGVGDDWPFSYADLEPFYDLNDARFGIAGLAGDPAYPPKPERPMPPIGLGKLGMTAARGFDRLGWHWWPVDSAINSRDHLGRPACNHCGPCQQGCVNGAKASTDMTHWPYALGRGVELRTGAVVLQVEVEAGRARGVTYRTTGGDVFQPAQTVVVAGNGVGTARLLLASGIASPALGRNLMFHGAGYVRGFFAEDLDGPVGPTGCAIYSHEFYETDRSRGFVRGVHLQVTRENPLAVQAARLAEPWGIAAHRALLREFRRSMAILVVNEDFPEAENHVALSGETGPDGLPGVKVVYRISEHTRRSLDFGLDRAEEMLRAAGAIETVRVPLAPFTGWHLLGTARMGSDPATSVTDGSGRVHGVAGLIVADGSLFTTSAAVNPGSTIGAVATKVADDFAREAA